MQPTGAHSIELPKIEYNRSKDVSPEAIVANFLPKLQAALQKDKVDLTEVFQEDSWLRDHLAFSWDLRTRHGRDLIENYLSDSRLRDGFDNLKTTQAFRPNFANLVEGFEVLEYSIIFETAVATCKGMIRMTPDRDGNWKIFMFYSAVEDLKGYEEQVGRRRPHGGRNTLAESGGRNWLERRERQKEFLDEDPTVLIIGAGHSGLNIGARLQALQVPCLLIDRNERVGDNWRLRYRTLSTHDPVHTCHLAYIPFPATWSFFTPKDKLAGFLEAYAELMELNVWLKSNIVSSSYNEQEGKWTVEIKRGDGSIRKIQPHHIIFCTGHSGEPKVPSFPGQETFKGSVYHGSQHKDAANFEPGVSGKNVIVVGSGNSGHDIAQNFCESGANTTMLQRSDTYVIGADKGLIMLTDGLYGENSPKTEDADLYSQSMPMPIQFRVFKDATTQIAKVERETLDGLEKAGFGLSMGIDGGGIFRNYYTKGGGYYIDVGASKLIVDGEIKVKQSRDGIQGFDEDHLILASGEKVPADIVVLATGYDNMRTSLRKALGDKVADRCHDVWGPDEEGEMRTMWRSSGHPGLWCMGGNLNLTRTYSKFLALQIKAIEIGLNKQPVLNGGAVN